jgi:TPR repeat protein
MSLFIPLHSTRFRPPSAFFTITMVHPHMNRLTKSAENGNPRAQYLAATTILEVNTRGTKEEAAEIERALKWMQNAAEQNDPMAQAALGAILLQGDDESARVAVDWLRRADAQGSVTAHYLLGQCVEQGRGGLRADQTVGARLKKEAVQAGYMAK